MVVLAGALVVVLAGVLVVVLGTLIGGTIGLIIEDTFNEVVLLEDAAGFGFVAEVVVFGLLVVTGCLLVVFEELLSSASLLCSEEIASKDEVSAVCSLEFEQAEAVIKNVNAKSIAKSFFIIIAPLNFFTLYHTNF